MSGLKKYVHITGSRGDKFVEFDFAIDDPLLYVELMLPPDAFEIFCTKNDVTFLNPMQVAMVNNDRIKWRYGSPGLDEAGEEKQENLNAD
ncbi:MAG: phenol hydroxylase [Proteobacteria bacterium]|nr:phenol hydroxylase [Pseudomonadota bacterium]